MLGALPAIFGGDRGEVLVALAVVGAGGTVLALLGYMSLTSWAVGALGLEYAVFIFGRQTIDFRAPIVGGALSVLAELVQWYHERHLASDDREARRRRLSDIAMTSLASIAAGSLVLLAGVRGPGSVVVAVIGLVASVATLALIWVLAARPPGGSSIASSTERRRS